MDKDTTAKIIVSSVVFRKFLKEIIDKHSKSEDKDDDELIFTLFEGDLVSVYETIIVEHKGSIEFNISVKSIINTIKALKHAPEQPIILSVASHSTCIELQCCF